MARPGELFKAGASYEVRDQMNKSVNVYIRPDDWFNIPNEYIIEEDELPKVEREEANCSITMLRDTMRDNKLFAQGCSYDAIRIPGDHFIVHGIHPDDPVGMYSISSGDFILDDDDDPQSIQELVDDCWGIVSEEIGVGRTTVKEFMMGFLLDSESLPELAKAHMLSAQSISHIILAFNKWTGAVK